MKTQSRFALMTVLATAVGLMGTTSCSKPVSHAPDPNVDYYTCSMHPAVKMHDPKAKCPQCNMTLTPVMKRIVRGTVEPQPDPITHDHAQTTPGKGSAEGQPTEFIVPVDRQQQIGVTYTNAQRKPLHLTVRTVGTVSPDQQRHWDYVARVEGYVSKLFVFSRGERVEKDQPLLTIYSPDLLTTQREFLELLRLRDDARAKESRAVLESTERLMESAKTRLRLWNIGDKQIAELEQSRQPQEQLTLYSPFRGVVQELGVDQGRKVMAGDHLVDVADLSVVWVWADFYQEELALLKTELPVTFTTSAYPTDKFSGRIAVVDPFINEARRTGRVRLDIANPDLKLRPDMYVNIELALDMGEGLTVPVSAVMPTGRHNLVFVDKGAGRLEPRFVELGRKFGDDFAVLSGLKADERVVNSANFLIDAESKIQGALKSW